MSEEKKPKEWKKASADKEKKGAKRKFKSQAEMQKSMYKKKG